MKRNNFKYWMIVLVLLSLVGWTTYLSITASFLGTDDQATEAIQQLAPQYTPWFSSLFEPSSTLEVFIFVAQGAIGVMVLAICLALYKRQLNRD